jgi:hypothetical protein
MSISKTFLAGVIAVGTFGITTTAQAQEAVVCLDGSVGNGDCILVMPPQANNNPQEATQTQNNDDE